MVCEQQQQQQPARWAEVMYVPDQTFLNFIALKTADPQIFVRINNVDRWILWLFIFEIFRRVLPTSLFICKLYDRIQKSRDFVLSWTKWFVNILKVTAMSKYAFAGKKGVAKKKQQLQFFNVRGKLNSVISF